MDSLLLVEIVHVCDVALLTKVKYLTIDDVSATEAAVGRVTVMDPELVSQNMTVGDVFDRVELDEDDVYDLTACLSVLAPPRPS